MSSPKISVRGFALTYSVPLLELPIDQTITVLRRQGQRQHNRLLLGIYRQEEHKRTGERLNIDEETESGMDILFWGEVCAKQTQVVNVPTPIVYMLVCQALTTL
jgi:hypothetical protein